MTALAEPDILCSELVRIFTAQGVEVQALQGLDLRVDRGELVALVGASGSGKSTLLNILAGLDTPTAGVARVAGHDLTAMGRRERVAYRRGSVGFIWQQTSRNLVGYLTAAENIAFAQLIARVIPRDERATRATELLELLEIGHLADRRPSELSGGQQQRVALAVALANGPRVLLADEPTGELDEATSAQVLEAMETVGREHGLTTLVVTHDAAVAEHVDRTIRIRDGRTSTEVLRRTHTDADGARVRTAEEFAVLDRAGRMQLPAEFTGALGLRDRVRLSLEPDRIEVRPGQSHRADAAQAPDADAAQEGDER
jgi:ABC-type lipoprotein export system ATPase subunit